MNSDGNKAFEEFVIKKISYFNDTDKKGISKEQRDKIILAYKLGFIDALKILRAEKKIETQIYV